MGGGWVENAEQTANEVDYPEAQSAETEGIFSTPIIQPGSVEYRGRASIGRWLRRQSHRFRVRYRPHQQPGNRHR
jgi:hypothetical protein